MSREPVMVEYDRRYIYNDLPIDEQERQGWKDQVERLSNIDLLENANKLYAGDDWDGCLTDTGGMVLELVRVELTKRLIAAGFLREDEKV